MRILEKQCSEEECKELEKKITTIEAELEEYMDEIRKIEKEEETEKSIDDIITEFLDTVLSIKRIQSLIGGKWETEEYHFLLAYGGPNIWVYTDGSKARIEIYWGFQYMKAELSDKASEFLSEVFRYMTELEGEIW